MGSIKAWLVGVTLINRSGVAIHHILHGIQCPAISIQQERVKWRYTFLSFLKVLLSEPFNGAKRQKKMTEF